MNHADREPGRSARMARLRGALALGAAGVLVVGGLSACSGENEDAALKAAEVRVTAKQEALDGAQSTAQASAGALCQTSASYVTEIDRYGDLLTQTPATVGDVRRVGDDLAGGRDQVVAAAQEVQAAQEQVELAEKELMDAQVALAKLQGSQAPEPTATEAEPVAVQPASIDRVKQAESDLASTQEGIDDNSVLREAAQQFNSAVVALEMAWLQLFAESGCLSGTQREQAVTAVAEYTSALQQELADAGYFDGAVDGVYGPQTVDAVLALQKANGLPQTGAMDKATSAALQAQLAAEGGSQAQAETASTAAVQQTLKLTGYWDGPVDGKWSDELSEALMQFQSDLGVEPTGSVDAATIAAFSQALEDLGTNPAPTPSPTETLAPSASASPGPDGQ